MRRPQSPPPGIGQHQIAAGSEELVGDDVGLAVGAGKGQVDDAVIGRRGDGLEDGVLEMGCGCELFLGNASEGLVPGSGRHRIRVPEADRRGHGDQIKMRGRTGVLPRTINVFDQGQAQPAGAAGQSDQTVSRQP